MWGRTASCPLSSAVSPARTPRECRLLRRRPSPQRARPPAASAPQPGRREGQEARRGRRREGGEGEPGASGREAAAAAAAREETRRRSRSANRGAAGARAGRLRPPCGSGCRASHGHGAVRAEALPQLPAPPQGAPLDCGADRGRAPHSGTARRGLRDRTEPALRGAAATRGRTGRRRPLAAPSPPPRPSGTSPAPLVPCPPVTLSSLSLPCLPCLLSFLPFPPFSSPLPSCPEQRGRGRSPYPPPRTAGLCLVSV